MRDIEYTTHVAIRCLLVAIAALIMLCLLPDSWGQAPTPNNVTGHMAGISGTPIAGTYIEFLLTNCGGSQPRIFGYFGIAPLTGDFLPDSTGLVTGTIWPNDYISCGGVTGNTRWQVTYVVNNIPTGPSTCYQVLSSVNPFNLDTAVPATPCITSTPILPNDQTAHNFTLTGVLAGVNGVFGGTLQAHKFLLDFTPSPCTAPQFIRGLNADFTAICASPVVAPVSSVFGRANAVVAAIGDYSCSQVTGCPTVLRYQTVKVAGVTKPQEPALNFVLGSGVGITCADNPGVSTDCTVSVTSGVPTFACVSAGCTLSFSGSAVMEWGLSSGVAGGGPSASVAVTFPTAFSAAPKVVCNPDGYPTASDADPLTCYPVSVTTTGFTAVFASATPVGGGGGNINNTIHAIWHADGN